MSAMADWLKKKKQEKDLEKAVQVVLTRAGRPASWPQFYGGHLVQVLTPSIVHNNSSSNNASYFYPFGGGPDASTNEALRLYAFPYACRLKRVLGGVGLNTKDAATTLAFRDDGVNIWSTSVPAANVDDIDSGALDVAIAAGSEMTWLRDTAGSTTGNITFGLMAILTMEQAF